MKKLNISINTKILEALKLMTKIGEKSLVVSDKNKTLLGILSDGDCRKAILKGVNLNENISKYYNKNPIFIFENNYKEDLSKKIFIENKITLLPIVDSKKKLVKILLWNDIFKIKNNKRKNIKIPTVIMAGGFGSRMKPFTDILPKALIPINDKTIIEHIITKFNNFGVYEFYISINYKADVIRAYLNDNKKNNKNIIKFEKENKPLGTLGALSLIKNKLKSTFFLTNCDILIKADYDEILKHHKVSKNDLTILVSVKELNLPYGHCNIDDKGLLIDILEKPKMNFLVNTGFYVMEKRTLKIIEKNKYLNFDKFVKKLNTNGYKIGVFPIDDEAWADLGNWSDYSRFKSSNLANIILE